MSLLHPTTSDIWDRMIVLLLKIEHGKRAGKPTAHFQKEYAELSHALLGKQFTAAVSQECIDDLKKLHRAIWEGIAVMMERPTVTDENAHRLAKIAVNLQAWNGERVRIKHEIDKATGEYVGEEKI
jgi:hypothetical protein